MAYIIEGPDTIGNIFGSYGHKVPEGKFVVVTNDEYNNGGSGPCQWIQGLFTSREEAEKTLKRKMVDAHDGS